MDEQVKPKPCPFCGGEAEIVGLNHGVQIRCKPLRCVTGLIFGMTGGAIAAWNTRHEPEEVAELRAAVDKLPKTADGVPVALGDYVYTSRKHRVLVDTAGEPMYYVPEAINVDGDWRDMLISECYSTPGAREAALAAKTGGG